MKKENQRNFSIAICLLIAFVTWTLLIKFVDIQPIGPQNSVVGFGTVNNFVHNITGKHMWLYTITDWLGLVPFCFVIGFAVVGLIQLVKRKSILKVDYNIIVLGVFYVVVMAIYLMFETVVINYRPVLIEGVLEVSYPSSTTMLVLCVMPTAIMQLNDRIKNNFLKRFSCALIILFIAFMVVGRLICGVHWFTDIVGGIFLSAGLDMLYYATCKLKRKAQKS